MFSHFRFFYLFCLVFLMSLICSEEITNFKKVFQLKKTTLNFFFYCFILFQVNETVNAESVIGDLSKRLAHLVISGSKSVILESRTLFTLDNLPLSGLHSILGKSLVIFDDHGPKARGDRLACSKLVYHYFKQLINLFVFRNHYHKKLREEQLCIR